MYCLRLLSCYSGKAAHLQQRPSCLQSLKHVLSGHWQKNVVKPCRLGRVSSKHCCWVMSHSLRPHWGRTVAFQDPLSMGYSRQEYWNWLPFPPLGHLPDPGIEPMSPTLQMDSLLTEPLSGFPQNKEIRFGNPWNLGLKIKLLAITTIYLW